MLQHFVEMNTDITGAILGFFVFFFYTSSLFDMTRYVSIIRSDDKRWGKIVPGKVRKFVRSM